MNTENKHSKLMYIRNAIFILIAGLLGTILITQMVNSRIQEIFINEAINLSKSYSQMLNLSTSANKSLESSIDIRLAEVLRLSAKDEDNLINNQEAIDNAVAFTEVSVMNVFDKDGVMIASSMPEYIGEVLPKKHPIRDFMASDQILFHDKVRESKHTHNKLKHTYFKTDTGNIIQASIGYKHIAQISEDFHPLYLLNSLKADIDVIDVEMIFDDAFDLLVLDEIPEVKMNPFKANARYSDDLVYKVTKDGKRSILELGVPVHHQNQRIGTLIVYRNLQTMDEIKHKAFNMTFSIGFMIMFIYMLDVIRNYVKDKTTLEDSYKSSHSGIYNKKYLYEYIEDNAIEIASSKQIFLIINLNSYDRFKLILDEERFKAAIHRIKDIVLKETKLKNDIFEYDDSTLVLLYDHEKFPSNYQHHFSLLEEHIENYELYNNYFLIKSGILKTDEDYQSSYDIKTGLDNAVSTLKHEDSDSLIVFGDEL